MLGDKRGEVEHVGGTPFSGVRASGKPFVDEDAAKKSVTDAVVKALSLIGFGGDIFMGRYDDSAYVREVAADIKRERDESDEGASASYVRKALAHIAKFSGAAGELKAWFAAEAHMREALGIVNGEPEFAAIFNAFRSKGLALSSAGNERAA